MKLKDAFEIRNHKIPNRYTAEFGPFMGEGKTIDRAIYSCQAQARQYSHQTRCFVVDGTAVFIWCEAGSCDPWSYQTTDGARCGGYASADQAERKARVHVAQNLYSNGNGDGSIAIENKNDLREHLSWVRWQDAYKAHKQANPEATDEDCRRAATGY